jgi:hypothetical protein
VTDRAEWLLFLHQIPPKPAYFRVKVLRRLNQLGALAIKNSAYLLPALAETLEDLQWLLREIRDGGGEAWILRSEMVAGETDESLRDTFRKLHATKWLQLSASSRDFLDRLRRSRQGPSVAMPSELEWTQIQRSSDELKRIDFFTAPERAELEVLMKEIEAELHSGSNESATTDHSPVAAFRGRTWVTRAGIKVDRIASSWLIRRFIDPAARFEFVEEETWKPRPNDLRFDMFDGEFTHEGDRCTFEVLLERIGLSDYALTRIAEIVHDADLKDGKFMRPEAPGVMVLIEGIVLGNAEDRRRIEEGARALDAVYASFRNMPQGS